MWRTGKAVGAVCAISFLASVGIPALAAASDKGRFTPGEVVVRLAGEELPIELRLPDGVGVLEAAAALRSNRGVAYAVPNYFVTPAGWVPNDPGLAGQAGGWRELQWNFRGEAGVRASRAWSNLIAAGQPGGAGATVAIVDTGVAYRDWGKFRKSPDFATSQFTAAKYDFAHDDPYPLDKAAHGTPVAGVVAERTNNSRYLTGLAYGAKLMPIRSIDGEGGEASDVAKGIRYAADRGADVINLSLQLDAGVEAEDIPEVTEAIDHAHGRGVVLVAAAGNQATGQVAYPGRAEHVIAVGAVSIDSCLTSYSNWGVGLDLVAPGGGPNAAAALDGNCSGKPNKGTKIYQVTFDPPRYGYLGIGGNIGTSMSSPHVAAAAAMVIASGVLGPNPTPEAVEQRLESTARNLGTGLLYGAGLLDVAAATTP